MGMPHTTFWKYTVLGAVGGIALLICLYLICPAPQPLGRLVYLFSFPVVWLFEAIVELLWHDNPDQGLAILPLFFLALLAYWAAIGIAVAWTIYWSRMPKPQPPHRP